MYLFSDFKKNRIDEFHYNIRKIHLRMKPTFGGGFSGGSKLFYQSHPKINVLSQRPTISRISNYDLMKYINKSMMLIDLGANVGFFSLYLSDFVKSSTLVEFNPYFNNITNKAIQYLDIKNCKVINANLNHFLDSHKESYDFVLALAIYQYLDFTLEDFILKIDEITKPGGFILLEAHPEDHISNYLDTSNVFKIFELVQKGYTDDQFGRLREYYLLRKRL